MYLRACALKLTYQEDQAHHPPDSALGRGENQLKAIMLTKKQRNHFIENLNQTGASPSKFSINFL